LQPGPGSFNNSIQKELQPNKLLASVQNNVNESNFKNGLNILNSQAVSSKAPLIPKSARIKNGI
jgi:hypothetical protein